VLRFHSTDSFYPPCIDYVGLSVINDARNPPRCVLLLQLFDELMDFFRPPPPTHTHTHTHSAHPSAICLRHGVYYLCSIQRSSPLHLITLRLAFVLLSLVMSYWLPFIVKPPSGRIQARISNALTINQAPHSFQRGRYIAAAGVLLQNAKQSGKKGSPWSHFGTCANKRRRDSFPVATSQLQAEAEQTAACCLWV